MVAAVDDDHVLGAADDVDVAARQISHVAGIEPAVGHAGVGGVGIAEIAGHQRRPRAPDLADRAVGKRGAVFLAAFDGHVLYREAAMADWAESLPQFLAGPHPPKPKLKTQRAGKEEWS